MIATVHDDPARQMRRRPNRSRALIAIGLSVAFHIVFVALIIFLSLLNLGAPAHGKPQAVALRSLSEEQWLKNRGATAPPPAPRSNDRATAQRPAPPAAPVHKPEPTPNGQVVDVAPGNGEESPDAKYLAESANKVKRETHAKDQTAFYRNAMPRHTTATPNEGAGKDNVEKPQLAGNNGVGTDDRPLREPSDQKHVLEIPDTHRSEQLAVKPDQGIGPGMVVANRSESDEIKGNSRRLKIQLGGEQGDAEASQGKKGAPGVTTLTPSMAVLDKINGAAPNDHLGDVDEGEGTYLNTKEWKYSGFFNRVKQSVGMHWDPGGTLRQRDRTGEIYGGRDRYTVLNVTLNERGMLKDVFVEKSCGLDFLDLEAISAFEHAQPFPNPPPGLLTADSTVRFTFGFYLEMGSSGPRMRLFRQAN
jgi:TonB family protein